MQQVIGRPDQEIEILERGQQQQMHRHRDDYDPLAGVLR